jgi:hypothetical protein
VLRPTRLRGPERDTAKALREAENASAIGGMRRPVVSLSSLPELVSTGKFLNEVLSSWLSDNIEVCDSITDLLAGVATPGFGQEAVMSARREVRKALGLRAPGTDTGLQADLFDEVHKRGDPDEHLATWLRDGAPLGVSRCIPGSEIFPQVVSNFSMDPADPPTPVASSQQIADIATDPAGWENYRSAESDPTVCAQLLDKMVISGWATRHDDFSKAQAELKSRDITLDKLGLVTKTRPDGTMKHRLIWDLRRSGVNSVLAQGERIILPKLSDLAQDVVELAGSGRSGTDVRLLGTDITDAFHLIPLHESERRFTLAAVGDAVYEFRVLVFGSGSAPTVWGRFAAFLGRTVMAVTGPKTFRAEIYVDDPLFMASGSESQIVKQFTIALLWISVLGFPVSWSKSEGGNTVRWIGAQVSIHPRSFDVSVPQDKVEELIHLLKETLSKPVIPTRQMASLAGKLNFFAGLIPVMRPFLATLWATLSTNPGSTSGPSDAPLSDRPKAVPRLPPHLVHTRRARHGLTWFLAFFLQQRGTLTRSICFDTSLIPELIICTDASPWGIGGFVLGPRGPGKWFADPLGAVDEDTFGVKIGEAAGTTTWEALAVLVAVRVLRPRTHGVRIRLRADSLSTLFAVSSLKAKAPGLALIMSELALERAEMNVDISECTHIPGMANTIADALSRLTAPEAKSLPNEVNERDQVFPPVRGSKFWTSRVRSRAKHRPAQAHIRSGTCPGEGSARWESGGGARLNCHCNVSPHS